MFCRDTAAELRRKNLTTYYDYTCLGVYETHTCLFILDSSSYKQAFWSCLFGSLQWCACSCWVRRYLQRQYSKRSYSVLIITVTFSYKNKNFQPHFCLLILDVAESCYCWFSYNLLSLLTTHAIELHFDILWFIYVFCVTGSNYHIDYMCDSPPCKCSPSGPRSGSICFPSFLRLIVETVKYLFAEEIGCAISYTGGLPIQRTLSQPRNTAVFRAQGEKNKVLERRMMSG